MSAGVLPESLQRYVRQFVARQRQLALIRSGGLAISFAIAWAIAACLVDRWLRLPSGIRLALLIAGVIGFAGILIRPFRLVLRRRLDWVAAAAEIELCNPQFAEALRTVVSQLLEPPGQRGAPGIISELLSRVEHQARETSPRFAGAWKGVGLAWVMVGILIGVAAALRAAPSMGMPLLIERLLRPMAPVPPVTTTRIDVTPGDHRLVRGSTLVVRARVSHLKGGSVDVLTSHTGAAWTRAAMVPVAVDEYALTIPAVDRDLVYRVEAGDGASPVHRVTVDRPPAVVSWRFRYEYPDYAARPAFTASSGDGSIDALTGTKVQVTLVSSEPLKSVTLVDAAQTITLEAGGNPQTFDGQLVVLKDQKFNVQMISDAGLRPAIPVSLNVRAERDRQPAVALLDPAEDLRMSPRDSLAIAYRALDDYGISKLSVKLHLDSGPAREMSLAIVGDPRRQEGVHALDLAALDVTAGDVLAISLNATDGAGQIATSASRNILISPVSVDRRTRHRLGELRLAAEFSQAMRRELVSAARHFDRGNTQALRSEQESLLIRGRYAASLANAIEAASLLHHSLLRAAVHPSGPRQSIVIAALTDRARVLVVEMERLAAIDAAGEHASFIGASMRDCQQSSSALAEQVQVIWHGDQAAALRIEMANLKQLRSRKTVNDRLEEVLYVADQELELGIEDLGISIKSGDIEAALEARVVQAQQLMAAIGPLDLRDIAEQWAKAILKGDTPPPLAQRFSSASMIEAIRPQGDPIFARDLQLAGRAAARLSQQPARDLLKDDRQKLITSLAEFVLAVDALRAEHERSQHSADSSTAEMTAIHEAALNARRKMELWAQTPQEVTGIQGELSDLALAAGASSARRQYDDTASLDRRLRDRLSARESAIDFSAVDSSIAKARKIDEIASTQREISNDAMAGADGQPTARLAARQREILSRIEALGASPGQDSRRRALQVIHQAQEELALLPQRLAAVVDVAEQLRKAQARAHDLAQAVSQAPDERRPLAQRMAEQARRAESELAGKLKLAVNEIAPDLAKKLAAMVRRVDDSSANIIDVQLQPALLSVGQSAADADVAAIERAAGAVRQAIELSRKSLGEAQSILLERDPLIAARWFAEASAAALESHPPDYPRARSNQTELSGALNRAWRESIRDAARHRLALTPSFAPILRPGAIRRPAGRSTSPNQTSVPRRWTYAGPLEGETMLAPLHESDPPGYEEQLRAYFGRLEKAQNQK